MRKLFCVAAIATAACLGLASLSTPARSHYGLGLDEDPCVQSVGPYLIHFSAYQPESDPAAEYCDVIPRAANAIFVFDLVDRELRKELAEIKVERQAAGDRPRETLLQIPARRYPSGVVNAEFRFDDPGEYAAVVTLVDLARMTRFPLRVGIWSWNWLPVAGGALVLGVLLGYGLFRFRQAAQEPV